MPLLISIKAGYYSQRLEKGLGNYGNTFPFKFSRHLNGSLPGKLGPSGLVLHQICQKQDMKPASKHVCISPSHVNGRNLIVRFHSHPLLFI